MLSRIKKKRGSGGDISILILLIAFFILIYVILLPPETRDDLLNDSGVDNAVDNLKIPQSSVILSESPGKVYSYSSNIHKINFEPLHLYSKIESETQSLVKSLSVSKNLLKDNYKTIYFNTYDTNNLKKLKLFFIINERKGPISIYLNNQLIFEGTLTSSHLPLELPLDYLQDKNKLEFYSASPGFKIFSSNHYLIQDLKLIKEYLIEKKESSRTFIINKEIGEKINQANFEYFITCNTQNINPRLTITLNNIEIFKDTIFCNYLEKRSLPLKKDNLKEDDRNKLSFEINDGDIYIDEISLKTQLTKSIFPTYTFDISSNLWNEIINDNNDLILSLKMAGENRKKATITIQDEIFNIDTSLNTYEKDISSMVNNGANVIKIQPLNNFEINNLKIYRD